MRLKIFFSVFAAVLVMTGCALSNSLWTDKSSSNFSTQRPYKDGDIIMVLIIESTSAVQKAGTDTSNQDSLSADFTHSIEKLYKTIGPSNSLSGARSNAYKGAGSTTRSSNVLAAVSATVTKILPNGDLEIAGTHRISVNEESQEITIKGVVRARDITGWNTVYSYQVANSTVAIKGTGSVGEAAAPGIISRVLNWIF